MNKACEVRALQAKVAELEKLAAQDARLIDYQAGRLNQLAELETQCDRCGLRIVHSQVNGIMPFSPVVTCTPGVVVTCTPGTVTYYPPVVTYSPGEVVYYPTAPSVER